MKRVLPLVLLGVLIELACYIWLGVYLFKERQAFIPFSTQYKVEDTSRNYTDGKFVILPYNGTHITKFLPNDEYRTFQRTHIITYRKLAHENSWSSTFLGLLFFTLFFILVVRWIAIFVHLSDSYNDYDEYFYCNSGYPFILGAERSALYNKIIRINTTPLWNSFNQFWGY